MVQFNPERLDSAFSALSDSTRRGVLERLARGDASISLLADAFGMTPTGMKKHVGVLESAGFVVTEKVGRVRTCRLGARRMAAEAAWIEQYRHSWEARFAALDRIIADRQRKDNSDGRDI